MLYLLNERTDSEKMHWFVIDFFNDVTGVDANCHTSWDIQAKASKNINAKLLGEYSTTLFKNYCSELNFNYYILFVGGVGARVRTNPTQEIFKIQDMQEKAQESFLVGLKEAVQSSSYIENDWICDSNFKGFLETVTIVVFDKSKVDIIKSIAKIKNGVSDEKLISIFNEIRDKQSALKNYSCEGQEINAFSDFIKYKKYIYADDIRNMIFGRLLNYNESAIPVEFKDYIDSFEYDLRATTIKKCKENIWRVIFNKNNTKNFWKLFSRIKEIIIENTGYTLDDIYDKIEVTLLDAVPPLDANSTRLFISIIKEGLKNDN